MKRLPSILLFVLACVVGGGCRSPYHADRGALFGGLTGAGVGAVVGDAVADNPESGALVGAAFGAVTGAAVGQSLDDIEARNRAQIEAQLGRRMMGAATINDVVAMNQAGLGDEVIITYLRTNGLNGILSPDGMIALKQQGVSDRVIQAMQQLPPPGAIVGPPPTVIVREPVPWYWDTHWGHHHHHHHHGHHGHRPGVSWGFSFEN